ncbi:Undecaprenyldiphospho-muramoylpentapeptide beta-N- acetylglucosaminyltransferase [Chlamydia psittaci 02DC14]|nr:Undecaprenyldiphospho-muramoylpentapeptide beta-N- acetylglucosaminyltransferase [Chlamydia psittaci 02DC14]
MTGEKDTPTPLAKRENSLFTLPGTTFCSCKNIGIFFFNAAINTGREW